jgi:hypothetical protein
MKAFRMWTAPDQLVAARFADAGVVARLQGPSMHIEGRSLYALGVQVARTYARPAARPGAPGVAWIAERIWSVRHGAELVSALAERGWRLVRAWRPPRSFGEAARLALLEERALALRRRLQRAGWVPLDQGGVFEPAAASAIRTIGAVPGHFEEKGTRYDIGGPGWEAGQKRELWASPRGTELLSRALDRARQRRFGLGDALAALASSA